MRSYDAHTSPNPKTRRQVNVWAALAMWVGFSVPAGITLGRAIREHTTPPTNRRTL